MKGGRFGVLWSFFIPHLSSFSSDPVWHGVFLDVEADFGFWRLRRGRGHELADGIEEGTDGRVVAFDALLQVGQFAGEFGMTGQHLTELNKGAHDRNVDQLGIALLHSLDAQGKADMLKC